MSLSSCRRTEVKNNKRIRTWTTESACIWICIWICITKLYNYTLSQNLNNPHSSPNMKLLNGASDWRVSADLKTSLQFPVHIIQTEKQPNIVAWSNSKKHVLLIELTVPWEENREEAHEQKKNRYETLHANCVEKGWICHVIPIEVGCHGFIGNSVISFLSKIGITGRSLKVASNRLQTAAQYTSSWIWSKAGSFQHEGNTRRTTFPMWLHKKRLP